MQVLQGIAVSPGVAMGEALVIDLEGFRIPRRFVARDAVDHELKRLDDAIAAVGSQIEQNRDAVAKELGQQYGAIFSAHLAMLRDEQLYAEIGRMVRERNYTPEYAVSRALRRYAKVFQSLPGGTMAERAVDLFDIEKQLLRNLLGRRREELDHLRSPVILLAYNLTPSETANLDPKFVQGFITEVGGAGGHTAIVAEALRIPAVVGVGKFMADVSGGDLVIVDGDQGRVILQPDEETIARYRHEAEENEKRAARLGELRELRAITSDGAAIELTANIEFPHEAATCLEFGADGVGLYRTEFLYLGTEAEPNEETHYRAYAQVVQAMGGRPVTIRTLDLGSDKLGVSAAAANEERNPCLGLRSIRMSLRNLPDFRTQLRAILRASVLGDVRIMFPLITTIHELRQARMVLSDVMEDLEEQGIPFQRDLPVGMMVEVPAAVVMLDKFLREVDFVSIGTNDLIQYALAVDRGNKDVANLYNSADPAVLRLIDATIQSAAKAEVPVNLCGQMSGSATYTMLLLGLGLRRMSVPPSAIPEIKKICRSVTLAQCQALAQRAMEFDQAREIKNFLKGELRKIAPELASH